MNKIKSGIFCGALYSLIFAILEFLFFYIIIPSDSGYSNFFVRNSLGSVLHMIMIFVLPYVIIIATLWIVQKSSDMIYSCRLSGIIIIVLAIVYLVTLLILKQSAIYAIVYNLFMATGGIRYLNYKRSKKITNISL